MDGLSVVLGDATCEKTLEQAAIGRAKSLACVLPNDALNVFITLTATEQNRQLEVIARAEDPRTESKLRSSGAHHVIMPAAIGALHIARIIAEQAPQAQTEDSSPKSTDETELCAVSTLP